jgi:ankyrin repeat protein
MWKKEARLPRAFFFAKIWVMKFILLSFLITIFGCTEEIPMSNELRSVVVHGNAKDLSSFLLDPKNPPFSEDQNSIVHYAGARGQKELIEWLKVSGFDLNLKNRKNGATALHFAAQGGHLMTVARLVELGADINARDNRGETPMFMAAMENFDHIVKYLLSKGADANLGTSFDAVTPLMIAVGRGHSAVVEELLLEHADFKLKDRRGWSALMFAIAADQFDLVKILLEKKSDLNIIDKRGWSPLMLAAENLETKTLEEILKYNPNIEIKNELGLTALLVAAQNGHPRGIRVLLKSGANVHAVDEIGRDVVMLAASNGRVNNLKELEATKVDINRLDTRGQNALMHAILGDQMLAVEYLLSLKSDINQMDIKGRSPIMLALQNSRDKIVEKLYAQKPDLKVADRYGLTAKDFVKKYQRTGLSKLSF